MEVYTAASLMLRQANARDTVDGTCHCELFIHRYYNSIGRSKGDLCRVIKDMVLHSITTNHLVYGSAEVSLQRKTENADNKQCIYKSQVVHHEMYETIPSKRWSSRLLWCLMYCRLLTNIVHVLVLLGYYTVLYIILPQFVFTNTSIYLFYDVIYVLYTEGFIKSISLPIHRGDCVSGSRISRHLGIRRKCSERNFLPCKLLFKPESRHEHWLPETNVKWQCVYDFVS